MLRKLRLTLLSLSLGSCSLLIPLVNAEPCGDGFIPSCEGNTLVTCEADFLQRQDCADLTCNATASSCEGCGDGVPQGAEACDDGNDVEGDGCEADCTISLNCGDGVVNAPEQCDDANNVETDDCINCQGALCGDGFIQSGVEACDDNNNADGDGCDASCQIEIVCNPIGHDEDGDGVDDACDNCPTISNANQANTQETQSGNTPDPLGDACDPRPSEAGDALDVFDSFAGATLNPAWLNTSGWSVSGDKLVFTDLAASTIIRRADVDSVNVVAEIRTTLVDHGGSFGNNGLVLGMPSATDGLSCATEHNSGTGVHTLRLADVVNNNASGLVDSATITDPLARTTTIRMTSTTQTLCEVINEASANDVGAPAAGDIGIRSRTASMTVDSFIVYRLGP